MKVCHLTTVHSPLDDRIFFKECRTLVQAGYTVVVIGPYPEDTHQDGIRIVSLPKAMGRLQRIFGLSFTCVQKALRENADLYHFHDPEFLPFALFLKFIGKKIIYDVHEDVPEQILSKEYISPFFRMILSKVFRQIENNTVALFDHVVTATEPIRDKFIQKTIHVTSVKNYLLTSCETSSSGANQRNDSILQIIFVGGIYSERGLTECIQAIHLLDNNNIQLVLYGPVSEDYLAKLREFDSNGVIDYRGMLPYTDIFEQIQKSDVGFICDFPIKRNMEGLPVKLFEYMGAKLPVIASNFPLWKNIVERHECGICVDPMSPTEIAQAIKRLAENPQERRKMGENGYRAVKSEYSWDREGEKLLHIYKNILD